ncbi:MAG: cyclic nucleotide-binding domain-containing protein, partial [Anaerolineales bacterium]|nr:cyclic nucleotide-binding domain-containing protein [Anaerolineales bacterium]
MDLPETIEFLRNEVALFKDFPDARLKELLEGSRIITFEPNEAVIRFGEEGRFLGIHLHGEAEVSITDDSGEKHHIDMMRPGDVFGEMSLMTDNKTTADIIGVTRCEALLIPESLFSTVLITHPPALKHLSRTISERLRRLIYDDTGKELAASAFRRSDDPYGFKLRSDEPMKLLIVNCGSSSLKYNLFDTADEAANSSGIIEKIGEEGTRHVHRSPKGEIIRQLPKRGHREAFAAMGKALMAKASGVISSPDEIAAVGHRVVHGGDRFNHPVIITEEVLKDIEELADLAPLHNPVNLIGIHEAKRMFPNASNVAVFDTAFHQTLPAYAYLYGLPYEYYEQKGIRRYGFHGISHAYVSLKAAGHL